MKESLEDLAGLYVLDQLDHPERVDFEARLLREPRLAAFVRDLESGLARGIRALPPREPPADLLGRIEEHLGPRKSPAVATPSVASFPWAGFARWGIAAVITVSLATLAVQSLRPSAARPVIVFVGLDANRNTFAELPARASAQDPDARFIQLASLAENFWDQPNSLPVKTASASGNNRGYALFDPTSRLGFIAIEQLPVAGANQRYHLWIVDSGTERIHDAGILPLAGMNRGLYSFTLEPATGDKPDRPRFFITAEENNGAAPESQPRGKVVLGRQRI